MLSSRWGGDLKVRALEVQGRRFSWHRGADRRGEAAALYQSLRRDLTIGRPIGAFWRG